MEPDKILPTVRNLVKSGRCSIDVLKKSLLTYMDERPTDDMALLRIVTISNQTSIIV